MNRWQHNLIFNQLCPLLLPTIIILLCAKNGGATVQYRLDINVTL